MVQSIGSQSSRILYTSPAETKVQSLSSKIFHKITEIFKAIAAFFSHFRSKPSLKDKSVKPITPSNPTFNGNAESNYGTMTPTPSTSTNHSGQIQTSHSQELPKILTEYLKNHYGENERLPKQLLSLLHEHGLDDFQAKLGDGAFGKVIQVQGYGKFEGKRIAIKFLDKWIPTNCGYGEEVGLNLPKKKHLGRDYGLIVFGPIKGENSNKFHFINSNEFNSKKYQSCETIATVSRAQGQNLREAFSTSLTLEYIKIISRNLGEALKGLHSKNYIHGDLKPENVVLKGNGPKLKLIDFGTTYNASDSFFKKQVFGTPKYYPPEIHVSGYSQAGDVFAYGKIMYELATGHDAKQQEDENHWISYQFNRELIQDEKLRDLLFNPKKGLLNIDPKLRAKAKEILHHPFLRT